jgi:hypothetical protein
MKTKYSSTRFLLEYISILLLTYLLASGFVAFIGNISYRKILCSTGQMYAFMLLYWWIPIFRMSDMQDHNNSCPERY